MPVQLRTIDRFHNQFVGSSILPEFMMKHQIIAIAILLLSSSWSCQKFYLNLSGCDIDLNPDDVYSFPLVPGTPQWAELKSGDEQFVATQVPEMTAKKMSTDGLIETWLNYPLNGTALAHNSLSFWYNGHKERFNALRELISRGDASCKCLSRFESIEPNQANSLSGYVPLAVLVSDYELLDDLSKEQEKFLIRLARANYDVMIQDPKEIVRFNANYNLWICARAMAHLKYQPFIDATEQSDLLKAYLDNGMRLGVDDARQIAELARAF